jgi:hypothetical protein
MAIHESVINELKAKPVTMLLIFGLWAVVTVLWTDRQNYAMAVDAREMKQQISSLGVEFKRGNLETQLRNINTELFNLQQKVADMHIASKVVDQIYYDKLNELTIDRDRLGRELQLLK